MQQFFVFVLLLFCSTALLFCMTGPSSAAGIKVVPSSTRVVPGESFYVDIVTEDIPAEGLGAVQFRVNVNAPGAVVTGVSDISQADQNSISVAVPLLIGPPTSTHSGIGQFFLDAAGPHGILVMDNESFLDGSGLYTFAHTNGSTPPSGSGLVARFVLAIGKNVSAEKIDISLSEVMLLDSGTEYAIESNTGSSIDVGCTATVPDLLGLSETGARSALQTAGLLAGNIYEINNPGGTYALGQVLQQSVASGTSALCETVVDLAINTAPSEVGSPEAVDKIGDESGAVILSWVPSSSTDTAGYRIYLITGAVGLLKEISNPSSSGTEISGLTNGQLLQIKITAFDTFGNESPGVSISAMPLDDVAPTVRAIPAGGAFTEATSVSLEAVGAVDIYYTTDGNVPTAGSPRYAGPIAVAASTTIKAVAIDSAGNASQIMTETYTVTSAQITVHVETDKHKLRSGLKVYLFRENGSYANISATSDPGGNATFNTQTFPAGNYKFRVDYLGNQFWSATLALPGPAQTAVLIAEETVEVSVVPAISNITVYLFTESGTYLNANSLTDASGKVSFDLPVGKGYKFRADNLGNQYWSAVSTVNSGGTNAVPINVGGGLLSVTVQKGPGSPMGGVKTYLYDHSGSYLNRSQVTTSDGVVQYADVTSGLYKVRVDYLGYQFWTPDIAVSTDTNIVFDIPQSNVAVTVNDTFQGVYSPMQGVKVYLFTASGSYLNISKTTDSSGVVAFELPQKDYKVRADYLGQQFWSGTFNSEDIPLNVPMSDAQITVTGNGAPLQGVKVYVYSTRGAYLNMSDTTGLSGLTTFHLPSGAYKFRADYQGKQFWSVTEDLAADEVSPIVISTGGGSFTLKILKGTDIPLSGVKCYVFNEGGNPYLNMSGVTDALGEITFGLADGNYQFRADLLGYQFWSEAINVPQTLNEVMLIDHQDVNIRVEGKMADDIRPIADAPAYLYSPAGTYLSVMEKTGADGRVSFSLPQEPYMVRVDFLGNEFWSSPVTWQETTVTIPEGIAQVHVNMAGEDLVGKTVYVYDSTGTYLNISGTTDSSGIKEFRLPAGSYAFRADHQGQQFRISAGIDEDVVTPVEINSAGGAVTLMVDTGNGPLADAEVYVFTSGGTYLGMSSRTNESGQTTFDMVEGSFKFRVDYLGYEYWSDIVTVPGSTSVLMTISHRNTIVTARGLLGAEFQPFSGLPVYLFSPAGAYLGVMKNTDDNGQAYFLLPDEDYKMRVDYLGGNSWSDIFRFTDPVVTINEGLVHISVKRSTAPITGVKIYLFSEAGAYLGRFMTTDASGTVEFVLPDRKFKFRIDEGGQQYWSEIVEVKAGQVNELEIDLNSFGP